MNAAKPGEVSGDGGAAVGVGVGVGVGVAATAGVTAAVGVGAVGTESLPHQVNSGGTLTTQAVMMVSPVERLVASAAYGFVRFIGGGLAPYAAGRLVEHTNIHVPFAIGSGVIVAGIAILTLGHRDLANAERGQAEVDAHAGRGDADAEVTEAAETGSGSGS